MNLQIKCIAVYNDKGEVRKITFQLGKVNIITGKSSTGKSTLLDIVEYCFGRSDFRIPDGPIRENVSWYLVMYQTNHTQIIVAKKPPDNGGLSQSKLYFQAGSNLMLPNIQELEENSTDTALISYFDSVLGISPNLNIPSEDQSRSPIEASTKHARTFLFQKQGTVADQDMLFHRQAEPFIPQSIKDTMPYFLGAIQEDRLKLVYEYREAKRNLAISEKKLNELERVVIRETDLAKNLLSEAQQVGLVAKNIEIDNAEQIRTNLKSVLTWTPLTISFSDSNKIAELNESLQELEAEVFRKNDQIRAAEDFGKEADGFTFEATKQASRLESINLFTSNECEDLSCPLCSSRLEIPTPSIVYLNDSLVRLRSTLDNVSREQPKLLEYIKGLRQERDLTKNKVAQVRSEINALYEENENASKLRDQNVRVARVIGRISLYLESEDSIDTLSPLQLQVSELRKIVNDYEKRLDPTEIQDRLNSILNFIGSEMTQWAKRLELEHAGSPYRLDINKLTVVADRNGKPVFMNKTMGGGSNWLGCHIIALCALHKYFILEGRPVPGFLMLDQPTQVYFPPDKYEVMEGKIDEVGDEDRTAVARLFDFLIDLCAELLPNLQIIVTEHANIDSPRFQDAIIDKPWRGDYALIPHSWIVAHDHNDGGDSQ